MAGANGSLTLTVLGSGTSVGVPMIGCQCSVCLSNDPRDKRLRPSVYIQYHGRGVLIDTTPDFRQQALRFGIERVDAILYTHSHADHILGLDDVRPFNFRQRGSIPTYASDEDLATLQRVFTYVFDGRQSQSSRPRIEARPMNGRSFDLFGLEVTPIHLNHGDGASYGFRFGNLAYLTDHSAIPQESLAKLRGLDVLFLDALRHKPHPTHTTVDGALEHVRNLQPRRTFFTHMGHDLGHEETETRLPQDVRLAFDGLAISSEIPA